MACQEFMRPKTVVIRVTEDKKLYVEVNGSCVLHAYGIESLQYLIPHHFEAGYRYEKGDEPTWMED